ncbi:hypothetical protein Niako_4867 [Niastella koreensis GR20-10]|uniref:Uncharacterized protein n=1 Tax=Niastella koreensis (strain DSM 17620 / KACC 11465 / NBRC 106392 / GR20-10) TaxID=700598 RepID=G8TRI1_NIAKG|nr:hypothetical protein Niako_4867 [Niastella koreensis GR20-10]
MYIAANKVLECQSVFSLEEISSSTDTFFISVSNIGQFDGTLCFIFWGRKIYSLAK